MAGDVSCRDASTNLTTVAIGRGVTKIGGGTVWSDEGGSFVDEGLEAFSGCTGLTAIVVDPLNTAYCSVDGVLFDKSQTQLILCPRGKAGNYTIPNTVTAITGMFMESHSYTWWGHAAFGDCINLTGITIPNSVTTIGARAFDGCTNLAGVYFEGNAPDGGRWWTSEATVFYYLPGTKGWRAEFEGRPTALWLLPHPVILTASPSVAVQTNGFGFTISWATNNSVIVEASTNLTPATWTPVSTNTLSGGTFYFSDSEWAKYPSRFYRVRAR